GRPQYSSSRNAARFSRATCSRQATSLGHARHSTISAVSAANAVSTAGTVTSPRSLPRVRLRLIVNPIASSMTGHRLRFIQATLAAGTPLEVVTTTGRDHGRELAREAADDGVDVVIVASGDGTLNEAANGLVGTPTALAPIPAGSTNVFARAV